MKMLLGHSDRSITAGYGGKLKVGFLHDDIKRIVYPEVEKALGLN